MQRLTISVAAGLTAAALVTAPVLAADPGTGRMAAQALLQEIQQEAQTTRRVLERIPASELGWKPHESSRSAGELAWHVAEVPGVITGFLAEDSLDFSSVPRDQKPPSSVDEILAQHDRSIAAISELLTASTDADLMRPWTLYREPGQVAMTIPRIAVVRSFLINHWIHHRGQVSVYLRMLEVPVPSIYGPSGDELPAFLAPQP